MDIEAHWLLEQIKADQQATSERMHRDARRQHALKAASLQLGTGKSAAEVKAWIAQQHLVLRPDTKKAVVDLARKIAGRFDQYSRRSG